MERTPPPPVTEGAVERVARWLWEAHRYAAPIMEFGPSSTIAHDWDHVPTWMDRQRFMGLSAALLATGWRMPQ